MPSRKTSAVVIGGITIDTYLSEYAAKNCFPGTNDMTGIPLGSKHYFDKTSQDLGGGGANVATALVRLGHKAYLYGSIGNDSNGKLAEAILKKEGIDTSFIQTGIAHGTGAAYIANINDANPLILACRGANREFKLGKNTPTAAGLLYVSGISDSSIHSLPKYLIEVKSANQEIFIALNPGASQIAQLNISFLIKTLPYVSLVILNKAEAGLFWKNVNNLEKPDDQAECFCEEKKWNYAANYLLSKGVQYVCITHDAHGATLLNANRAFHTPAVSCTVTNTLGAGDAFGATLASGLSANQDPGSALRQAAINAASVVSAPTTRGGLLSRRSIRTLEQKYKFDNDCSHNSLEFPR